MYRKEDIVYRYDGSWAGFLCCVFAAVYSKEQPFAVLTFEQPLLTLFEERTIETETEKARRVEQSFAKKLGPDARPTLMRAFLCDDPDRDTKLLRMLLLGYKVGPAAFNMLGHADVAPVLEMARSTVSEAHQYKGFLRFADYGDFLGAVIEPKNQVLPLLQKHFCQRYPEESFLIYDRTHRGALLHQAHKASYVRLDEEPCFPEVSKEEEGFQDLWKTFYRTIAIKARENPQLRRSNCPMRYWGQMTELKGELQTGNGSIQPVKALL